MEEIIYHDTQIFAVVMAFILLGFFLAYLLIVAKKEKESMSNDDTHLIHKDTIDFYLNQLQHMIEIYTVYKVEELTGANIGRGLVNQPISNEDLIKGIQDVRIEVYKDMSDNMKGYLMTYLSESYLDKYIRNYTMTLFEKYVTYVEDDIENITQ